MPCDLSSKESCGFRSEWQQPRIYKAELSVGPMAEGRLESINAAIVWSCTQSKKKIRKRKKTKPLKKFWTIFLAKLFFFFEKKKMQPEANDANKKAVSGPALRADGSLLGFSIRRWLHQHGDLRAGAACSVRAILPTDTWSFWCPRSSSLEVPCLVASSIWALLGNLQRAVSPTSGWHGLLGSFYAKSHTEF